MNVPAGNKSKTPRQLWVAIILSLVLTGAVIYFGFLALPSLAPEHQAFWSGLIGSFVGSAVAFGGAGWLWRMERHILVEERTADRIAVRAEDRRRHDLSALRDCLAVIGNLQALNYHMLNEKRFATARDKYLMRIRFDEAVSSINDQALRSDLDFLVGLVDDDQLLDHIIGSEWLRLDVAHDWLLRLISLEEGADPSTARPKNYENLIEKMDNYEEIRREEREEADRYEQEQKAPKETVSVEGA